MYESLVLDDPPPTKVRPKKVIKKVKIPQQEVTSKNDLEERANNAISLATKDASKMFDDMDSNPTSVSIYAGFVTLILLIIFFIKYIFS